MANHSSTTTHRSKRGQVIIIMLGIMSFALVVGLAISSRVITGIRQASYSTQSAQALAFAEAGAEHALLCLGQGTCSTGTSNLNIDGVTGDDCVLTIDAIAAGTAFNGSGGNLAIACDETVQINLSTYTSSIDTYWFGSSDSGPKAMEVSLVFSRSDTGAIEARKCAWDPQPGADLERQQAGLNSVPGRVDYCSVAGAGYTITVGGAPYWYRYRLRINLNTIRDDLRIAVPGVNITPRLFRIKALYGATDNALAVAVPAGYTIPAQGYTVTSRGTSGSVTRAVRVTRTTPALSEMFDYVLFEGNN